MKSDKLVWIGPYMTTENLNKAVSKGYKQVAATLSQQYFIDGLEKNGLSNIEIISAIRPPAFPDYKDLIVSGEGIKQSAVISGENLGFINIKYFSHLCREFVLIRAAKKWANRNKVSNVKVIVYSLHSPFLKAALKIKEIIPNTQITVIVPDLPLNMDMSSSVQKFLKEFDWVQIKRMLEKIDKFVLFTKDMADYLGLKNDQWIVIEGLIDEKKTTDHLSVSKYSKKICLYMGSLKNEYRIDRLVEAFINASVKESELHIYGNGDFKKELEKISSRHKNIKYCGYVSSEKAFEIMKKATLLFNPRPKNDDYTKYSCPSKTFEYMASGTPLLTTKLPGIPNKYFDYTYCFGNETLEEMAGTIKKVLSLDKKELKKQGRLAREFIRNEKNNTVQVKKMIEFMGVLR